MQLVINNEQTNEHKTKLNKTESQTTANRDNGVFVNFRLPRSVGDEALLPMLRLPVARIIPVFAQFPGLTQFAASGGKQSCIKRIGLAAAHRCRHAQLRNCSGKRTA